MFNNINIELTNKCNLNCSYCYQKQRNKFRKIINNDSVLSNINEILSSDIKNITLTGGEPTISNYFYPLIGLINNEKNVYILTNGIKKIDLQYVKKLNIVLSIDGNFQIMKRHRNIDKNTYQVILENFEYYKNNAKSLSINSVITKYNYKLAENYTCIFSEDISYSINSGSSIFTPNDYNLTYNQLVEMIYNFEALMVNKNYHIDIRNNIITKKIFLDLYSINNPIKFFPEYNIENNIFYYLNKEYKSIYDLKNRYLKDSIEITKKIIEFLKFKMYNFRFDPYSLAEYLVYKEMI